MYYLFSSSRARVYFFDFLLIKPRSASVDGGLKMEHVTSVVIYRVRFTVKLIITDQKN